VDVLKDAVMAVEALRERLPEVVTKAAEELIEERDRTLRDQNALWGASR